MAASLRNVARAVRVRLFARRPARYAAVDCVRSAAISVDRVASAPAASLTSATRLARSAAAAFASPAARPAVRVVLAANAAARPAALATSASPRPPPAGAAEAFARLGDVQGVARRRKPAAQASATTDSCARVVAASRAEPLAKSAALPAAVWRNARPATLAPAVAPMACALAVARSVTCAAPATHAVVMAAVQAVDAWRPRELAAGRTQPLLPTRPWLAAVVRAVRLARAAPSSSPRAVWWGRVEPSSWWVRAAWSVRAG